MPVALVNSFKHDGLHFHAPTFNNKGQKNVDLSFDKSSTSYSNRITFQIGKETKPFVSKWALSVPREGEDGKRRSWEMNLDDEEAVKVLEDLDNLIIENAILNSREWFKKTLNKDQIEARYKRLVKDPKNEGDKKTCFVKLNCPPSDRPTPIMKIVGEKKLSKGCIEDLTANAEVIAIVRIPSIWFMSDSFGATISVEKLIVKSVPKKSFDEFFSLSEKYEIVDDTDKETGKELKDGSSVLNDEEGNENDTMEDISGEE